MDRLTNDDRGTFAVLTEHSTYRISITDYGKFLIRHPRHALATDMEQRDDRQVPLLTIEHMVVGEPAVLQLRFPVGFVDVSAGSRYVATTRTTTPVMSIERVA